MSRRKKNRNPLDYISLPKFDLDERAKHSIVVVIFLLAGLISLLGLFNLAGHFGQWLATWLTFAFGFGKLLMPILLL